MLRSNPITDFPALIEWIRARSPSEAAEFDRPDRRTFTDYREAQAIKKRILQQENEQKLAQAPTMTVSTSVQTEVVEHHELLGHAATVREAFSTYYVHRCGNSFVVIQRARLPPSVRFLPLAPNDLCRRRRGACGGSCNHVHRNNRLM